MKKKGNVLVVTYWGLNDALIRTYTLPYIQFILDGIPKDSKVFLITLDKVRPRGVELSDRIVHLSYRYRPFRIGSLFTVLGWILRSLWIIRRERIGTIHAWCTPAGAIGYILSKFTGVPLVIDSYEPHAEAMVENGTWKRSGLAFKILFRLEKAQTHHASYLIAAAEGMKLYAGEKYGHEGPMFVKPAGVDLEKFSSNSIKDVVLLEELGLRDRLIMVYAGKFGGIYLDQQAFDLFKVASDHWGPKFHVLLLTSHTIKDLLPFMEKAGVDQGIFTVLFVPHDQIPRYLGLADLALTPVKPVPTKKYCTPIKDGEYWAMGLPVMITSGISNDTDLIEKFGAGSVIKSLDGPGYRLAIEQMDHLLKHNTRIELYEKIRPLAEQYRSFAHAACIYARIYQ